MRRPPGFVIVNTHNAEFICNPDGSQGHIGSGAHNPGSYAGGSDDIVINVTSATAP